MIMEPVHCRSPVGQVPHPPLPPSPFRKRGPSLPPPLRRRLCAGPRRQAARAQSRASLSSSAQVLAAQFICHGPATTVRFKHLAARISSQDDSAAFRAQGRSRRRGEAASVSCAFHVRTASVDVRRGLTYLRCHTRHACKRSRIIAFPLPCQRSDRSRQSNHCASIS